MAKQRRKANKKRSQPQKPVPVMHLPYELLSKILAQVDRPMLARLATTCRRWLPIVREELYRYVSCSEIKDCEVLTEVVQNRPELGALVKAAFLYPLHEHFDEECCADADFPDDFYRDPDDDPDDGRYMIAPDEGVSQITLLLPLLPNIEHLEVRDFTAHSTTRILHLARSLTRLTRLNLEFGMDDLEPRTARSWWEPLQRLRRLEHITLRSGEGCDILPIANSQYKPWPKLRFFRVDSDCISRHGAPNLAHFAPNLEHLEFIGAPHDPPSVLEFLETSPDCTQVLRLYREMEFTVDDLLPRFTALTELVLCGGSFTPEPLLQFLSSSRVKKVEFRSVARKPVPADDSFLLALVQGDMRPKALRLLVLDHYGGPYHTSYLASQIIETIMYSDDVQADLESLQQAAKPKWPAGCTEDGLLRILQAASVTKVTVTGSALSCIDWKRTWDTTLERTAIDILYPDDSEATLVSIFGRERGVQLLREKRPGLAALLNGTAEVK